MRRASSLTQSVLGWEPKTPLLDGLSRTVEWFRTHPDVVEQVPAPRELRAS